MDITAHRALKQARDIIVDTFHVGFYELVDTGRPHGVDDHQAERLRLVEGMLWDLMNNDPQPPECQTCATPLEMKATGRPARYCSDTCRSKDR